MTKTHGRNMKKHKDLIEVHKSTSWFHTRPPPQSDSCPVVPTGSSHRHWWERLLERPCCGGERSSSGVHAKATDGHFVLSTGERVHVMYTAEEFWLTDCHFLASPLKQYKVLVLWSIKETKNIWQSQVHGEMVITITAP